MDRENKLNLIDIDIKLTFTEFCKKRIDILNSVNEHTINIINNNHVPDYDLKLSTQCKYFFNMPYQIISKYKTYFKYLLIEKLNNAKEIPFGINNKIYISQENKKYNDLIMNFYNLFAFNHKNNNINKSIDFFQLPKEEYTNMYNDIKYIFNVIKLRNTDIHSSTLLYIPINNNNFTSSILDLDIYFDTTCKKSKSLNKLIETFFKYFSKIDEIFWFLKCKIKQIYDIVIEYSKKYKFLYFEYIEKSYKIEPVELNLICSYNNNNIDFDILHTNDFTNHTKFVISINKNNNKKYNFTNLCIVSNFNNNFHNNIDIKSSICLMKKIILVNKHFINLNIFKYTTSIIYNNTNTNQNLFIEYIIDENKYLLDNIIINDYYAIYDINIFDDSDIKYLFQKNENLYNIESIIKHIIKLVKYKKINDNLENDEYYKILHDKILKYIKDINTINNSRFMVNLILSQFDEIIENIECVSKLISIYKLIFTKYDIKNIIDFIEKNIKCINYLIILLDDTFFNELKLFEISIDYNICTNLINMRNVTNSENIDNFLRNKNIKVNITKEINIFDFQKIYSYYNRIIPIPTYCNIEYLINKSKFDPIIEEYDLTVLFN